MLPSDDRLEPGVVAALERVEDLISAFESDPDEGIQEMAVELLQSIDAIHRRGLTRLVEILGPDGSGLRERVLADPHVRLLFELYDLLPEPDGGFVPLEAVNVIARRAP